MRAGATRKIPSSSNRADVKNGSRIHALLVDDNQAFLRAATGFMQRHHDSTIVDASGVSEGALDQVQDLQPQVLQIDMETISRLRKVVPGVSIIALTLLNDKACRQAVLAARADDLVHKAELVTDLLQVIQQVIQTKRSQ